MKVYSDTLTRNDMLDALPQGVTLDKCEPIAGARVRRNGWNVSLRRWGSNRLTNSGRWGAGERGAASWDDHGAWMAELFSIDPGARIAYYDGAAQFHAMTDRKYLTPSEAMALA